MRSAALLAIAALAGTGFTQGPPPHAGPPGGNGPPGLGGQGPPGLNKPKKMVSQKELVKQVKLKDLMDGAQKLQDIAYANGGNRAFGGGGHNATVDYLVEELKKTGYYNVYKQPFVELFTAAEVETKVNGELFDGEYMTYGPSGVVSAPLVLVNNIGCTAADYPAEVVGNVALIKRGECTFGAKAELAKAAGAAGAIIYNNVPGRLSGTLGAVGDYAPTVGVSQEIGDDFLAKLGAGEVIIDLDVLSIQENR